MGDYKERKSEINLKSEQVNRDAHTVPLNTIRKRVRENLIAEKWRWIGSYSCQSSQVFLLTHRCCVQWNDSRHSPVLLSIILSCDLCLSVSLSFCNTFHASACAIPASCFRAWLSQLLQSLTDIWPVFDTPAYISRTAFGRKRFFLSSHYILS